MAGVPRCPNAQPTVLPFLSPPGSWLASPAWSLLSWQPKALGLGAHLSTGLPRESLPLLRGGGGRGCGAWGPCRA